MNLKRLLQLRKVHTKFELNLYVHPNSSATVH